MSGLSRTPGKRVGANNPPRVRIPILPPNGPVFIGLQPDGVALPPFLPPFEIWFGGGFRTEKTLNSVVQGQHLLPSNSRVRDQFDRFLNKSCGEVTPFAA
jgi:hypothetical protein